MPRLARNDRKELGSDPNLCLGGLPGVAINRLVRADALEFCRGSVQLEGDLPSVVGKNINLPNGWFWQTRQGVQAQRPCAGIALQQRQRIFGRPNNIRRQATHL